MKKSLYILLLTLPFFSFAQLSVRNNGFIFVSNEVLYVEDDINLNESNSKVYLRNEAQLIQGNDITGNSGIGELSVYQTGNANNFTYNYWCSPVGIPLASAGNSDNRVDLIDQATNIPTPEDPTGLISSVDANFTTAYDGTATPLTISNRWLYNYIASDEYSEWISINENTPINVGLGFTMKGVLGGSNQLYDFRGKPNNGTITNPIEADQYTLIGNPYPSAIDALEFIHDPDTNTSVTTGALYYWEQIPTSHFFSSYIGGYATYTISSTGMETFTPATFYNYDTDGNTFDPGLPDNEGDLIARRYIPIGQGFMIEGASSTPTNSMVYLKNSHRVFEKISDGNSEFFRVSNEENNSINIDPISYNEDGLSIIPAEHKRFRLNVTFDDEFTRQLVHNFHTSATDGFDYGFEAKMASSAPTEASWVLDDVPYVIQAHNFNTELVIPVIISAETNQALSFSLFDVQNFEEDQTIFLHDIENNVYVNLREQNYNLNILAGVHNSRFEIVFNSESLNQGFEEFKNLNVFADNTNSVIIVKNPNLLDINTVKVYDINGRLVINELIKQQNDRYNFSSELLSDGVYLTKITTTDNKVLSKKLILKK